MKNNLLIALSAFLVAGADAQSINLDIDADFGMTGASPPSATFGAAGLPGFWNRHVKPALYDLQGNVTTASFSYSGGVMFTYNLLQGYTGDDELLMADILDDTNTLTFTGLVDGTYDVYTYAQAPDSTALLTDVTIDGITQTVGGAWLGTYIQGNTHAFHTVDVVGGMLSIGIAVNVGFSSVNGVQLVLVPEPATIAALGLGLASLLAARRRPGIEDHCARAGASRAVQHGAFALVTPRRYADAIRMTNSCVNNPRGELWY